jgi:hypothetical protein
VAAQKVRVGPAKATPTTIVKSTPGLSCLEPRPSANGEVPHLVTQGTPVAPATAAQKLVGWSDEQEFESLLFRSTLLLLPEQWDPMYVEGSNCWPMMRCQLEVDTPTFERVTFSLSPQDVGRTASQECQVQPPASNLPSPALSLWPQHVEGDGFVTTSRGTTFDGM